MADARSLSSVTESLLATAGPVSAGEAKGEARQCAATIIQILIRRAGTLDPGVATRIRGVSSIDTLQVWLNEALDLPDDESAHRLIAKISKASLS